MSTSDMRAWGDRVLKRGFDIFLSALGLLFLAPFFGLIAILIKREDAGPVFFHGSRVGLGGREFNILKFRTMREAPESYNGPRVTARNDQRVTPLGRWLRDTKLNELPQLWNVLKGEMSLVGPRPEDPQIAAEWPEEVRREILSIRPGVTSPASISYRNEEERLSADDPIAQYLHEILPDKMRLDRLYIRHHSFLGDLDILFWTAIALLPAAEQRIPESKLFAGPFNGLIRRNVRWFFIDLVVSMLGVSLAGLLWRAFKVIDWGLPSLAFLAVLIALVFSLVNHFFGLDRVLWSRAGVEDGAVLVFANLLATGMILAANFFHVSNLAWLPYPALSNQLIFLIGLFTALGGLLSRFRLRLITGFAARWIRLRGRSGDIGERVIILGAGEGGQIVNWLLHRQSLHRAFSVIGMVDDDPAKQDMRIDGCSVLGNTSDLPALVAKHDIGVIIFAIANLSRKEHARLSRLCEIPGVRVVFLNDILGTMQSRLVSSA
ncbi:MAG: hypothetical protein HFACDABA_02046 [Anaerolineales bacterium]|nr:hypothetical protein [Anaerolineales bacterium]